ncbi:MAG: hypothetical protein CMP51_06465 [Flavobacteriales bacterium]|nr:hypothetical protein [Flavobacteriales bacterium]
MLPKLILDFFLILLYIYICIFIVQLYFLIVYFYKLYVHKDEVNNSLDSFSEGVSVIICAKNEEAKLESLIESFLSQKYHNFELIIVDDQSNDQSRFILKEYETRYPKLKVVIIEPHIKSPLGKKFALTMGIKTAKYKYLLLSDADCIPKSKKWLSYMSSNFSKKEVILGLSIFKKSPGLLNQFIRFDEFNVNLQYLSYALCGLPYMGVGRNLAYKKKLFFNVKGFASHIQIASGDDDLFIQQIANKDNVSIQIHPESIIESIPKSTLSSWISQKKRHFSTSKKYKLKYKFLLLLWSISNFLFWISSVLLLIFSKYILIILSIFIFRIVLCYILYYRIMKKLHVFDMYIFFPLLEFVNIFLQLFFVLLKPKNPEGNWS